MRQRLSVSTSGGRSSMYMAYRLWHEYQDVFDMRFIFANTGQELEETLLFVHRFEQEFGIPITWLEAEINMEKGKGTRHRIVSYEEASRDGRPYEDMIKKYGIPNISRPRCTEELKIYPIKSYKRQIGWVGVDDAIGIRADEPKRYTNRKPKKVYPMVDWFPVTKQDVLNWWSKQSFDLGLQEHEGNCVWCFKKSLSKHKRLLRERPEAFDFPERMEREYGMVRSVTTEPIRFFRGHRSVQDLRDLSADDDSVILDDMTNECGESCEPL